MATLNGAEFKIIEAEWSTYQNNVIQEILGSDTVEVHNQGHGSDPVRIQGMVNNEKEMDDFQEQFYSGGILTLIKAPSSNRQYQVYALGNVKKESIENSGLDTGILFQCLMQLRSPYSESVSTTTLSKIIESNNQEWSAGYPADNNLLKNWSFEDWSAGAGSAPDLWGVDGTGVVVSQESTIVKHDTYSVKITSNLTNEGYVEQNITNPAYETKTLTLGMWVYSDTANAVTIRIYDADGASSSLYHSGNSTWEWLTVTRTLGAKYAGLNYIFRGTVSTTVSTSAYFDGAVLIEGSSIPDSTLARDINTSGNVDAVPDIKVVGGTHYSISQTSRCI